MGWDGMGGETNEMLGFVGLRHALLCWLLEITCTRTREELLYGGGYWSCLLEDTIWREQLRVTREI